MTKKGCIAHGSIRQLLPQNAERCENNPIVRRPEVTNRIIALMDAQNAKGLAKYGTTIDQAKDADYDWRLMAMEELIDLAQYQQKEIMRLERLLNPKEE